MFYTLHIYTSEVKIQQLIRLSKVGSQKAAVILEKTGREGFVFELFLGGGSLGYVDSILYFYFLFRSRFALNFCFEVRSSFVEFVELWSRQILVDFVYAHELRFNFVGPYDNRDNL